MGSQQAKEAAGTAVGAVGSAAKYAYSRPRMWGDLCNVSRPSADQSIDVKIVYMKSPYEVLSKISDLKITNNDNQGSVCRQIARKISKDYGLDQTKDQEKVYEQFQEILSTASGDYVKKQKSKKILEVLLKGLTNQLEKANEALTNIESAIGDGEPTEDQTETKAQTEEQVENITQQIATKQEELAAFLPNNDTLEIGDLASLRARFELLAFKQYNSKGIKNVCVVVRPPIGSGASYVSIYSVLKNLEVNTDSNPDSKMVGFIGKTVATGAYMCAKTDVQNVKNSGIINKYFWQQVTGKDGTEANPEKFIERTSAFIKNAFATAKGYGILAAEGAKKNWGKMLLAGLAGAGTVGIGMKVIPDLMKTRSSIKQAYALVKPPNDEDEEDASEFISQKLCGPDNEENRKRLYDCLKVAYTKSTASVLAFNKEGEGSDNDEYEEQVVEDEYDSEEDGEDLP